MNAPDDSHLRSISRPILRAEARFAEAAAAAQPGHAE
jgi:hypothetical protein